ncbi:MAG: FAD-binding oxidoreductase [Alphaproteobacteria bacterium]|nr:MAG: FAD-binding oxidoreductase [Alphaproteobacteria bacterium]
MRPVSSWGRLGAEPHDVVELTDRSTVARVLAGRSGIAYGLGRSYGDACLNPGGVLWHTAALDRFIAFDPATGRLVCESGVVLRDIQRLMIPRGWSLPVVPGTQFVTVGGAIANDVHGKNHHVVGTFGEHVRRLRLVRASGETIDCGPDQNAELFAATVGGLGLSGLISEAELQLRPTRGPWLEAETVAFSGLADFFALSDESEAAWEHTVSWIDCTSGSVVRGLFMRARPSPDRAGRPWRERSRRIPLTPPISMVNRLSLKPFNAVYYGLGRRRTGVQVVHYEPFLFPLDSLLDWNRLYGPKGFFQYQSVVPRAAAMDATRDMLDAIAASGEGSILAVLKTFGDRKPAGLLSFPREGVTLALDFRNNRAATTLFSRLDEIVRAAGGRLYPAKDARMPRALYEATYANLGAFTAHRDPGMSSGLSRRLMGS